MLKQKLYETKRDILLNENNMPFKREHWFFYSYFSQKHAIDSFFNFSVVQQLFYIVLRASPATSSNFCTVWRMNSDFYLYLSAFSNTLSNRFSIPFSVSFKYYFFIHYLFFF